MLAPVLLTWIAAASAADTQPHAGMLRFPDVSASHIVFAYSNDLWLVSRDGGVATPLASPQGSEALPRFSPDGNTIAFTGNYEGNQDLYVIPAWGGTAERVTYHPATEILSDWTPDGQLLFSHNASSPLRSIQEMYAVPAEGGLPFKLPIPYGQNGAVSEDGLLLAYTPMARDFRTWKRYRGGMASDIWVFNLETEEARQITDWEGTDTMPMWFGDVLYYLSDDGPEHRLNIWQYNLSNSRRRQVTRHADYDVKWPSIGPGPDGAGEIVFQLGSELHLLDLGTETSRAVQVTIPGDQAAPRARHVDVAQYIQSWHLSPSGKRVVVEARGDVWTLPAEKGAPRNLTHSDEVAERRPVWSPDGRWIAYFSDRSGEYELLVTQSDGKGETTALTTDGEAFRDGLSWSPDSKHITFSENTGELKLLDLESGDAKVVDVAPMGGGTRVSWSHDSRWFAYSRMLETTMQSAVFLYQMESGESHQVTSGMFSDSQATFDRAGNYLYFASSRSFSPRYSSLDTTFIYPDSELLLAVPLRKDVEYPWLPESDEEEWDEEGDEEEDEEEDAAAEDGDGEEDEDEDADEAGEEDAGPADPVTGTWKGTLSGDMIPGASIEIMIYLTLEAGGKVTGSNMVMGNTSSFEGTFDEATGKLTGTTSNDTKLDVTIKDDKMEGTGVGAAGTVTLKAERISSEVEEGESSKEEEKQEKVEIDLEGFEARAIVLPVKPGSFYGLAVNDGGALLYVRASDGDRGIKIVDIKDDKPEEKDVASGPGFSMSADGKKILVAQGSGGTIHGASAGASGKPVSTTGMRTRIDPRREWRQVLIDAWRMNRQYFYDPNMHGVDWDGILKQYLDMLDACSSRADVTFVIGEMIGELNVGHAYVSGSPDQERAPQLNVGMLGVDFELDNLAYRIATIYAGAAWDVDARNPLQYNGVDVKEGEYLLAVNGVGLDLTQSPYMSFQGLAGKTVSLTVSEKPYLDADAREVMVKPMSSERQLRYRSWIEGNRAYVDAKTDGQVGYIYVPDTQANGQNDLVRQFYGQAGRAALIVDDRWNGGGQIPTRFIEILNRPATNRWATRSQKDLPWPPDSHQGPKCMLINGMAGSGGDAFPHYFRQAGLGKLVGRRTWGGLVGLSGGPALIDNGAVRVPSFAFFENDGTWGIEGHGVEPDIEVMDDPALMVDGGDPQLDAAIDLMLAELEDHRYQPPQRPPYPNRAGMGITDMDR